MKFLSFIFIIFMLGGCASTKVQLPKDQGVSCAKMTGEKDKETCIMSDTYQDRTRWHYLRPWEREGLGDMPDPDDY